LEKYGDVFLAIINNEEWKRLEQIEILTFILLFLLSGVALAQEKSLTADAWQHRLSA
jgi:hypothetical protein